MAQTYTKVEFMRGRSQEGLVSIKGYGSAVAVHTARFKIGVPKMGKQPADAYCHQHVSRADGQMAVN